MGKPANKQSNRNQTNTDKGAGKGAKSVVAKEKKVRPPKGPVPDFKPNLERIQVRQRLDLAHKVNEAKAMFTPFVTGVHGTYLVGYNAGEETEGHNFEVKEVSLPPMGDKPEKKFLAIQEMRNDGRNVFIPHEWLFHSTDDRYYAQGHIGEIQYGMLCFLKRSLCVEIRAIKHARFKAYQAAEAEKRKVEAAEKHAEAQPKQIAASQNVVPIQDAILERDCRPIRDLMKNECLGMYNMSDEKGTLIVQLRAGKVGNEFVVKKITADHHLASFLLEGSVVGVNNARRKDPEFDQHVRGLLALHGIILHEVKCRRDNRAHVTEGMPNFHTETLLAT